MTIAFAILGSGNPKVSPREKAKSDVRGSRIGSKAFGVGFCSSVFYCLWGSRFGDLGRKNQNKLKSI